MHNIVAQNTKIDSLPEKSEVKLIGRYHNNTIELRWYPTSAVKWRLGNKYGYVIERMELSDEGAKNGFEKITKNPLKPYTEAEWKSKTDMDNDFIRAAKEAVMSTPKMPKENSFDNMMDYQNEESGIFFTLIMATNLNAKAAEASGLKHIDRDIVNGKQYAYRAYINSGKNEKQVDTTIIFINNTTKEMPSPAPMGLRAEEEEGAIRLFWNYSNNRQNFVGYYIERSTDGGKNYSPLNKRPLIFTVRGPEEVSYTDSVKNYIPYTYRLTGITGFGDNSMPSAPIVAMGIDKTPPSPVLNTRAKGDRSKILISWDLPVKSRDLAGFQVGRSSSTEGPFKYLNTKILSADTRIFPDNKPIPKEPYYIVHAVDTAGNISYTFSVMASVYDTIAPQKPFALKGEIDSAGIVKIQWQLGEENDLNGYHVYTANGKDNVYRQITGYPWKDSSFTDTVNMRSLTKEVYYKITAVDYNNNPSPYSEILVLKRPDIIPPAPPLITKYNVQQKGILLVWINSTSDDIAKHELYRNNEEQTERKLIFSYDGDKYETFTDTTIKDNENYTYSLMAYDKDGNVSTGKTISISTGASSKSSVENLKAEKKENKILLSWEYTSKTPGDKYHFIIFKTTDGKEMKAIKTIAGKNKTFEDNINSSSKLQYAIKVVYDDGTESDLSNSILVN